MASSERVTGTAPQPRLSILGLSALGIVFGDIGTSPLYTFKTVLNLTAKTPDAGTILGVLSLVLWTLFIVTTVKYVSFAMRVDNDGEGGILALMSLLGIKKQQRPMIVALGLFGAALIYGDGAITPAISVLSALEGLNMATAAFQPYIVPIAVTILLGLFAIQQDDRRSIAQRKQCQPDLLETLRSKIRNIPAQTLSAQFIRLAASVFPVFRRPIRIGRQHKMVLRKKCGGFGKVPVQLRSLHRKSPAHKASRNNLYPLPE